MSTTRFPGALVTAILLLALTAITAAQTSKGAISGTVTDASGAIVGGAEITVTNTLSGETRTTKSSDAGQFRIEAIDPSIYRVEISHIGFATLTIEHLNVSASVVTALNPELKPGSNQESVQVDGHIQGIQTESAELSSTIAAREVHDLPLSSVNVIELALTNPGVVSVSSRDTYTNGVGFSADGLRPRANNFLIDGFDNNDYGIAGQAIQPQNPEAIKEVTVQTNSYAAEFGRGGSSVTNVIYAGGTNAWHGALWERYAGSSFNALTSEQARADLTSVPRANQNFYGFRIGGPILKNKLFIFGTSQWNPIRGIEQGAQMTLPTASGVATLRSLGSNSNVNALLDSLDGLVAPSANLPAVAIGDRAGCGPDCTVQVGTFAREVDQISDSYEYDVRGDYVANEKDTISARWLATHSSLTPDFFANPRALPGNDTTQSGPSRNLGVNWTHLISARAVNEVRFSIQTLNFGFDPTSQTLANPSYGLPYIAVSSSLSGLGFGGVATGFPQDRDHAVYQYQEALSWTSGHHNLKVGADMAHFGITDGLGLNSRGSLFYNAGGNCSSINLPICTPLANFIDDFSGNGGTASKQFGISQVSYSTTQMSYYVEDSWKLRPNLSLDYGLRYEFQGTPFNAIVYPTVNEKTVLSDPLTLAVRQQPDKNNFGPRFGVAYTPKFWPGWFGENKTVLRAGFGVFYDTLFSNILNNTAAATPNVTGGTIIATSNPSLNNGRGQANFSQVIPSITPSLSPLDSVVTAVSNLRNPLTYQWNANIQRELTGGWLATVAYVGTRGERLFLNEQLNPGVDGVRLNPSRGSILARTNHGDSIYHGLALSAEHNFTRALLFRGSYTWSRSIDNGSEIFATSGGTTSYQDLQDFRSDRGPSAFDRQQRAVFTWIYRFPGLSSFGKAADFVTRGWEISGTAAFESGAPETIYMGGFDINGDLSSFNDRPSLGNRAVPINYSATCLASPTCDSGVGYSSDDGLTFADLNTSFVGTAQDFRYLFINGQNGKIGRNSVYNPGQQNWTMAIQREFKIPTKKLEQQSVALRLEAFNPFNHPNLGGGENGVPTISGNVLDPNFLNSSVTRLGGRSIRLFIRYSF